MVKMACFNWRPRRNSESDQKLLQDVMPNGVADLDQSGNEIPGGLAGIRQRMAAMGHTSNPFPVSQPAPEDGEQLVRAESAPARRQKKAPAHGNENVDGNSDGNFTLSADVCTEDGNTVRPKQSGKERTVSKRKANLGEGNAQAIIMGGPNEDEETPVPSNPIVLGLPGHSEGKDRNNSHQPLQPSDHGNAIVLGPPAGDLEDAAAMPSDIIILGPPPGQSGGNREGSPAAKDVNSAMPAGPQRSVPPDQVTAVGPKKASPRAEETAAQVKRPHFSASKKKQENFLLELASIETAKQDAEETEKRALGQSTSDFDAVAEYFPGRDEVQKHLAVLSPGFQVKTDTPEGLQAPERPAQPDFSTLENNTAAAAAAAVPDESEQSGGSEARRQGAEPQTARSESEAAALNQGDASDAAESSFQRAISHFKAQAQAAPPPATPAASPCKPDATPSLSPRPHAAAPSVAPAQSRSPPLRAPPHTPPALPCAPGDGDPDHLRVSPVPVSERPRPADKPPPPPHTKQATNQAASPLSSPLPPPPPPCSNPPPPARESTLLPPLEVAGAVGARLDREPETGSGGPGRGWVDAERKEDAKGGTVRVASPRVKQSAMGVDRGRDLILHNIISFRGQHPDGAFHDWLAKLSPEDITEAIMRSSKGTGIWRELWDSVTLDLDGLQE